MVGRLGAILILGAGLGYGCDCPRQSFEDAREKSAIIFQGRITSIRNAADGHAFAVFQVEQVWKGEVGSTVEVLAWKNDDCSSFPYPKVGVPLVVYARRAGDGTYESGECGRTFPVSESKDLGKLGRGHKPKAE
jgi:hypothetical protein